MSYRHGMSRHQGRSALRSQAAAGRDTVGARDQFPVAVVFGLGLVALVTLAR